MVIEGFSQKRMASYRPHKDGRMSNPAKKLIKAGREAFLLDSGYVIAFAQAAAEAKMLVEEAMSVYNLSFEEALEFASSSVSKRTAIKQKAKS